MKFLKLNEEFIRHTGLMFFGIGLYNLFNLLYHLFMVRSLSPIDYGHLNTLMALFMVFSVPANTVQTTVTKYVSSFQVKNKYDQARELIRHLLILMSIIAMSLFLLVSLGSPLISSFLQIPSLGVIILFGCALLIAMVIPVPWGGLQGLQKYGLLSLNLIINGGLKFVLGIFFVFLGFGLLGAMGAITISYFFTIFLAFLMLGVNLPKVRRAVGEEGNPGRPYFSYFSEVYHYFLSVGITLLCFMVLTSIDLILVKHFFTPIEAGYYSIAQMVGKIILFLPLPVVMVMFPKLSSLEIETQKKKSLAILTHSLMIAGLLCGTTTVLCFLFPSFIIRILSGKVYLECIPLVSIFSVNMTLFSLTLILLYYQLSTDERRFIYPLSILTVAQIGLIILFHKTLTQVLLVAGLVSICLFVINFYLAYYSNERRVKG